MSPTAHFNISHVRESQRSTLIGNCFLELLNLKHKFCNCVVTTGLTISCGHKIQNNFFYRLEQPSQIQLVSCFFLVFFTTRWKYVFRGSRWFLFTWRTFLFAASFVLAISSLIEKVPHWSPNGRPQFKSAIQQQQALIHQLPQHSNSQKINDNQIQQKDQIHKLQ